VTPYYGDLRGREIEEFGSFPRSVAGVVTINQRIEIPDNAWHSTGDIMRLYS
jgi:hypothetical protein